MRTGELKWVFHTVPQEGEFGYDTWPAKDHNKFGGVHNWSEFTIDLELGIAYIPTGTARYDFYGGNREGDNLFANSIIALDARTGKRIWHYQLIHHDLWDFDNPNAPKLMTITNDGPGGNGKQIPIVIAGDQDGLRVRVRPPRPVTPLWPIEERPVPASDVPGEKASPTQPFPTVDCALRASGHHDASTTSTRTSPKRTRPSCARRSSAAATRGSTPRPR